MYTSKRLPILIIFELLSDGSGSPVDTSPARAFVSETSVQYQHTVSHHGAASLPLQLTHVSDSQGDEVGSREASIHLSVADRTDADERHALLYGKIAKPNTVFSQKETGSYVLDGREKWNDTQLYIALRSFRKLSAVLTPVESLSYNPVEDTNILRRSVRNESSSHLQEQTDINYRTLEDTTQPSKVESVAKCCAHDEYMDMDGYACVVDNLGISLLQNPLVRAASITKLTYTSFPTCETGEGYHFYYIDPRSFDDHGELMAGQVLEVVSMEGKCILSRKAVRQQTYCLEYGVDGSDIRPIVLVCPVMWKSTDVHRIKYGLMAVLLGVSCIAFFATALFLASTHVRRGLVTVRKVKTLTGRLQLSYVLTSLLGFLLLAVSLTVEATQDSSQCYAMAGLLIFFLLASFLWNTSICLESLFVTLNWRMSGEGEGRRYVLHSVWAWGVPGFITTLALTFSHYRASLPCSVITPRIGLYDCFFSDQKAKLVYLYVPMLLTLCANTFLLVASACVRSANLRPMDYCNHKLNHKATPTPPRPRLTGSEGTEASLSSLGHDRGCDPSSPTALHHDRGCDPTSPTALHHDSGCDPSSPTALHHDSECDPTSPTALHQHLDGGQPAPHSHNLWTESVIMVVWSGAMWFMEVIAFVVSQHIVVPSDAWYDYLWYIPSSVNALRGVGIFCILVLTSENRSKLSYAIGNLGRYLTRSSRPADGKSSLRNHQSPGSGSKVHGRGCRITSIATTVTQLSVENTHSLDSGVETASESTTAHPRLAHQRLAHSISLVDSRCSSPSAV